jgi:hypothetical protein
MRLEKHFYSVFSYHISCTCMALDLAKPLRPSKHFRNTWLRRWDWDLVQLREAMRGGRTTRIGETKYEIRMRVRGKGRKVILVDYEEEMFIITGAEGT